jgi:hypothetical protein
VPVLPDGGGYEESTGLWNGQIDPNLSLAHQASVSGILLSAED